MPIIGVVASSTRQGQATDTGAMFPLQVITVGPTAVSDITFTNIPNTYSHLQIRAIAKDDAGTPQTRFLTFRFNSDTASNYSWHYLTGNGSAASSAAGTSETYGIASFVNEGGTSIFGAAVIDILDYANTNKYKTVRGLGGYDLNGSGEATFASGSWRSTSAITSITLDLRSTQAGNFNQYSQFALYAIKGA